MKMRKVKCPQCGILTLYSTENKSRPFCSDRCKLIDLGAWAEEKFRMPTEEMTDFMHLDEIEKSEK